MKKTFLLLTILFFAALSTYAQDDNTALKLGVGFSFGGTTGSASSAYPVTGGLVLKAEYPISGPLNLTFTTGFGFAVGASGYDVDYYSDGDEDDNNGSIAAFVPLLVGAKYYVAHRFFVEGDVGASFNIGNTDGYPTKKIAPLVSPSAGYTIPFGQTRASLDLSLAYEDRIETGNPFSQVALRGVFNFNM